MESLQMFFLGMFTLSLIQLLMFLVNMRSMKRSGDNVVIKNNDVSVTCAQEVSKIINSPAFLLNLSYLLRNKGNLSDKG